MSQIRPFGTDSSVNWVALPLGAAAIDTHGTRVPQETEQAPAELDGWFLGPHDSVSYPEPHKSALNLSGTHDDRRAGSPAT
ncbi:hypothetical protein [Streptomyces sp. NPDC048581]|uniref:hypothetical protein n=1 Tax=unclassified Streptomyces TaxID=2593676 RepID=UPI003716FA49